MLAGLEKRGWLEELTVEQQATFAAALRGIWSLAGVMGAPGGPTETTPINWRDWVAVWEQDAHSVEARAGATPV